MRSIVIKLLAKNLSFISAFILLSSGIVLAGHVHEETRRIRTKSDASVNDVKLPLKFQNVSSSLTNTQNSSQASASPMNAVPVTKPRTYPSGNVLPAEQNAVEENVFELEEPPRDTDLGSKYSFLPNPELDSSELDSSENFVMKETQAKSPCSVTSVRTIEHSDGSSVKVVVYTCEDGTEQTHTLKYDSCGNISESTTTVKHNACPAPTHVHTVENEDGTKIITKYFNCGNGIEKDVVEHYDANGNLIKTVEQEINCDNGITTVTVHLNPAYNDLG